MRPDKHARPNRLAPPPALVGCVEVRLARELTNTTGPARQV